jgi:hypothetical protein
MKPIFVHFNPARRIKLICALRGSLHPDGSMSTFQWQYVYIPMAVQIYLRGNKSNIISGLWLPAGRKQAVY